MFQKHSTFQKDCKLLFWAILAKKIMWIPGKNKCTADTHSRTNKFLWIREKLKQNKQIIWEKKMLFIYHFDASLRNEWGLISRTKTTLFLYFSKRKLSIKRRFCVLFFKKKLRKYLKFLLKKLKICLQYFGYAKILFHLLPSLKMLTRRENSEKVTKKVVRKMNCFPRLPFRGKRWWENGLTFNSPRSQTLGISFNGTASLVPLGKAPTTERKSNLLICRPNNLKILQKSKIPSDFCTYPEDLKI